MILALESSCDETAVALFSPDTGLADVDVAAPAAGGDPLLSRRLRALLSTLPHAAQSVVILRYQQDLKPAAIAGMVGMTANTVAKALQRIRDQLRLCIEQRTSEGFSS